MRAAAALARAPALLRRVLAARAPAAARARGLAAAAAPAPPLAEAAFHELADAALARAETGAAALEDTVAGADVSLASGVLTLRVGAAGTFVLNKQTPTRQIWWSSPVSGPLRFEYDAARGAWVGARDGVELFARLAAELKKLGGGDVVF